MTTAQVVETSVTVNNNSPIQDYVHPDDQLSIIDHGEKSVQLKFQDVLTLLTRLLGEPDLWSDKDRNQ